MTLSDQEFERIVAEVIRRLMLHGVAVGERSSTTAELRITEKVVTIRSIEGRLGGVQRIVVESMAIVTPAVRDELKARKIELVRLANS